MTEPSALIPPVLQAVHIRFLNASTAPFPIDVLIDGMEHLQNSSFGTVSQYIPMADGFHKIAVRSRAGLRPVLFQGVFPFPAGQKITFSIADSPSGSITIIPVSNAGCFHCPARCGCYRIANMTFSGSSYDIRTPSGERVFCSISFGQSAPYKPVSAGSYLFFTAAPSGCSPIRDLPIILQSFLAGSPKPDNVLSEIPVEIEAGMNYTTYLIGNTWSSFRLQSITIKDDLEKETL